MTSPSVYRVVLIDDVAELRRLIGMLLQRTERFEIVAEAGDGASGVASVAAHRPDVALLDLSMPIMDGLEALPLIRDVVPSCRVVVLSGFEAGRMADKAMSLGASGYLTKGTAPDHLVRELLDILDRPPEPDGDGGSEGSEGAGGLRLRPRQP